VCRVGRCRAHGGASPATEPLLPVRDYGVGLPLLSAGSQRHSTQWKPPGANLLVDLPREA